MLKLFSRLGDVLSKGEDAVLVTVVATSGSAPRGAGARMLVGKNGRIDGTTGGGAVEYESISRALRLMETKSSASEHYHLRPNEIADLGMVCGGNVDVFFRYISSRDENVKELCRGIVEMSHNSEPCWLICDISPDSHGDMCVYSEKRGLIGDTIPNAALDALKSKPDTISLDGKAYYREQLIHPEMVYIFGGGHVAQALVPALTAVNFSCTVLEDREEFCRAELFGGNCSTVLITGNRVPDSIKITADDYVVIMTRGHKDDLEIQKQIIGTPAKYIGVIGSRKKAQILRESLLVQGFSKLALDRVKSPIGLSIGAETPAEIAVSVTAQMVMCRAGLDF